MSFVLVAVGGGALLGGIAGSMSDKTKSSSTSGVWMNPASDMELYGGNLMMGNLQGLESMIGAGPGMGDYTAGIDSQRGLAALLGQYQQSGGLPGQGDISAAQGFANDIFGARRMALQQGFQDQIMDANRQAATMGRDINDPILRAKLLQDQNRQSQLLGAEQMGFASQMALQLPGQRLGYAAQRADVLSQLGNQALQNKNFLLGLGSQVQASERNWRYQTGTHWGNQTQESGGGMKGALTGAIGGAGAGLGMLGGIQSLSGMGGGGMGAPAPMQSRSWGPSSNDWANWTGANPAPKTNPGDWANWAQGRPSPTWYNPFSW